MLAEDRLSTHPCAQSLIPVVMSGIIAVYGLVVSVLIAGGRTCIISNMNVLLYTTHLSSLCFVLSIVRPTDYTLYAGFIHLGAGLACGFTGLAAGYAIGYVGDSVRPPTNMWNSVSF